MSPLPRGDRLGDLLGDARRRTRLAVVGFLAGVFVTVFTGAIQELFDTGFGWRLALTVVGAMGLLLSAVAVLTLVRWVNERAVDLQLTLSTSRAVLWRYYPERGHLEFVSGDPSVVGATERVVTDVSSLRGVVDSADLIEGIERFQRAMGRGQEFSYSYRAILPSLGVREIAVRAMPVYGAGSTRIVGVSWDETDTRAVGRQAERTSRLYAVVGALGRATRSADTLERLYAQVCAAAVEASGFPLVCIAGEDATTATITPLAASGSGVGYLDTARASSDAEDATGQGPAGQALRQGAPVWSNGIPDDPNMAPWREAAQRFGLRSVAAVPFRRPGRLRGVLLLYTDQIGFFSVSERSLLDKLGDDLSAAAERLVVREEQGRQRALLEALVGSAPVPIFSFDPDGRVGAIWNGAAAEMFGWARDEVQDRPLPSVPADEFDLFVDVRRRIAAGEVIRDLPARQRRKDGHEFTVLLAAAPLHDGRGHTTGGIVVMMDQTERLAAEDRLRRSESRFRQLSEQAADVVYRYRLTPRPSVEYLNPVVEQLLGYTPEELYEMPDAIKTVLAPEEIPRFLRILADPESIEGRTLTLQWRHRDGSVVWVEHRGGVVRDAKENVVALEGIARDVTERKRFEEELARLSRVVNQTSEAVIVTELDGTIVYVNPAFEAISGWARDQVVGQTPRLLKSGQQSEDFYAAMWAKLKSGQEFRGRITNRRKDGTLYLADMAISPVRNASGTVVQFVALQRDVTRERDLEEQLRQSQKMEALGQLTGGIAHDFNNLLTIILSNAGLLAEALVDRSDLLIDVQSIRTAAGRGARVVRQLMQFGRRERLNPVPSDLGARVVELVHTFQRVLPENIDTQVDIEPGLPNALADVTAVEQMLLNLATNARDAMPDGGELRVSIRRRVGAQDDDKKEWVVVSVRDTGMGMSRDVLTRVFEPFYTTKPAGKGTGLGLAMVYGLMQQHGGRVSVYSEPGLGTTVRLMFPVVAGAVAVVGVEATGELLLGKGERVLLVEDEAGLRNVGERILVRLGYEVISAADGAAALELLEGNVVDLMITDVVMPGMTGPQLAEAVRARGLTFPIVFATGYAARDVLAGLGEDAIIVEKPWTLEDLASRIRQALAAG